MIPVAFPPHSCLLSARLNIFSAKCMCWPSSSPTPLSWGPSDARPVPHRAHNASPQLKILPTAGRNPCLASSLTA